MADLASFNGTAAHEPRRHMSKYLDDAGKPMLQWDRGS